MKQKKVTAIIAAGGCGSRMGQKTPKPFIKIAGKPILFYSLDLFEKSNLIDSIILVLDKNCFRRCQKLLASKNYEKLIRVVAGGPMRAQSVYNGLSVVDSDTEIVLIHDAARPFLTQQVLKRCIQTVRKGNNCLAAVKVKATIKVADKNNKYVVSTPMRKNLCQAQTPQVFQKKVLIAAYKKLGKRAFSLTDDAQIAEAAGAKVAIVEGSYNNIKITTKEDLKIAETIAR